MSKERMQRAAQAESVATKGSTGSSILRDLTSRLEVQNAEQQSSERRQMGHKRQGEEDEGAAHPRETHADYSNGWTCLSSRLQMLAGTPALESACRPTLQSPRDLLSSLSPASDNGLQKTRSGQFADVMRPQASSNRSEVRRDLNDYPVRLGHQRSSWQGQSAELGVPAQSQGQIAGLGRRYSAGHELAGCSNLPNTSPHSKSIDLLRERIRMEQSVQVGHDLQHLGSGRIAISLAKSMNQQRLATSYQGEGKGLAGLQPFMGASNFGTGSLAMQIARGGRVPPATAELSRRSSPGWRESQASLSATKGTKGSLAECMSQSLEGQHARSKTSNRNQSGPECKSLSQLLSAEPAASLNSRDTPSRNCDCNGGSSPISQLIDGRKSPVNPLDAPRAQGEPVRRSIRQASSSYRTSLPEALAAKATSRTPSPAEAATPDDPPAPAHQEPGLNAPSISSHSPSPALEADNARSPSPRPKGECPAVNLSVELLPAPGLEGSANVRAGQEEAVPEDAEPPESRPFVRPMLPVSGFAAEDAPGWRPPSRDSNSPGRSGSSGKEDSGNSRFWTVHSLNSWATGERRNLLQSKSSLHSKSSIQSLPSFQSWARTQLAVAGEDPSSLRRRNAIQLRRWATRARSPSKAAKLAKANALRGVQSNLEKPTQYSPHHSHSSNDGLLDGLPPRKRRTLDHFQLPSRVKKPQG